MLSLSPRFNENSIDGYINQVYNFYNFPAAGKMDGLQSNPFAVRVPWNFGWFLCLFALLLFLLSDEERPKCCSMQSAISASQDPSGTVSIPACTWFYCPHSKMTKGNSVAYRTKGHSTGCLRSKVNKSPVEYNCTVLTGLSNGIRRCNYYDPVLEQLYEAQHHNGGQGRYQVKVGRRFSPFRSLSQFLAA